MIKSSIHEKLKHFGIPVILIVYYIAICNAPDVFLNIFLDWAESNDIVPYFIIGWGAGVCVWLVATCIYIPPLKRDLQKYLNGCQCVGDEHYSSLTPKEKEQAFTNIFGNIGVWVVMSILGVAIYGAVWPLASILLSVWLPLKYYREKALRVIELQNKLEGK